MKDMFNDAIEWLKNTKMTKHYDSKTDFVCGCDGSEPLSISMKGDFTLNAIQLLAICAVTGTMCISAAIIKKLKS